MHAYSTKDLESTIAYFLITTSYNKWRKGLRVIVVRKRSNSPQPQPGILRTIVTYTLSVLQNDTKQLLYHNACRILRVILSAFINLVYTLMYSQFTAQCKAISCRQTITAPRQEALSVYIMDHLGYLQVGKINIFIIIMNISIYQF